MTNGLAVLFDLFGVLAKLQSDASKRHIESLVNVDAEKMWVCYWSLREPYDSGRWTGQEYWMEVGKQLSCRFSDFELQRLVEADIASWSEVDSDAIDLLNKLVGAGVTVGLLSNIPCELAEYYERTQPWFKLLKCIGLSCRIGCSKPSAGAFLWCSEILQLNPSEILFVDDRKENVEAASQYGFQVHQFTSVISLLSSFEKHGRLTL